MVKTLGKAGTLHPKARENFKVQGIFLKSDVLAGSVSINIIARRTILINSKNGSVN